MSVAEGLLRAIAAAPDDDAPRLIFADWLDENEQPERADFIRQQIQLFHLPAHDPDRFAIAAHTNRLWRRFGKQWQQPLPADAYDPQYERGLLDSVRVHFQSIGILPELLRHHPIRVLNLAEPPRDRDRSRNNAVEERTITNLVNDLRAIPELRHVQVLRSTLAHATTRLALPLADHLPNMTDLDLSANAAHVIEAFRHHPIKRIKAVGHDVLLHQIGKERWPHLRELDCTYSHFTEAGVEALSQSPWREQLEVLDFSSCGLKPYAIGRLANMSFPNLRSLKLSWNWVNRASATILLNSRHFPALVDLDLGDNDLYDGDIAAIAKQPLLRQLRYLSVRRNAIRTPAALALAETDALANLRYLDLADNLLGDEGLRAFLHSTHLPNLTNLDLRNNQLKSDGLYALVNSALITQLRGLQVVVGAHSKAWPYVFINGAALEMLDLQGSVLGDQGAIALLREAPPPNLTGLGLNNTHITDATVNALVRCPVVGQLSELRVRHNQIAAAGAKALQKLAATYPWCDIEY